MVAGMLFAAGAFVVAGFLQLKVDVSCMVFTYSWESLYLGSQCTKQRLLIKIYVLHFSDEKVA